MWRKVPVSVAGKRAAKGVARDCPRAYAPRMPAYVIADIDISDPEQYEHYKAAVPSTLAASGGRVIVRGGDLARLEGDWQPKRLVVLEFENLEAAKRWYDSADYGEAKRLREDAATIQMVAVEGL